MELKAMVILVILGFRKISDGKLKNVEYYRYYFPNTGCLLYFLGNESCKLGSIPFPEEKATIYIRRI